MGVIVLEVVCRFLLVFENASLGRVVLYVVFMVFSLPQTLVKTLANNLVKNLTKSRPTNCPKKIRKASLKTYWIKNPPFDKARPQTKKKKALAAPLQIWETLNKSFRAPKIVNIFKTTLNKMSWTLFYEFLPSKPSKGRARANTPFDTYFEDSVRWNRFPRRRFGSGATCSKSGWNSKMLEFFDFCNGTYYKHI